MKKFLVFGLVFFAVSLWGQIKYPQTPKEDVWQIQFGQLFSDPYRWMENSSDIRLQSWVASQNQFSMEQIKGAVYDQLYTEFEKLYYKKDEKDFDNSFDELLFESDRTKRFIPKSFYPMKAEGEQTDNGPTGVASPSKRYVLTQASDSGSDLKRLQVYDKNIKGYLKDFILVKFATPFWIDDKSFVYVTDQDVNMQATHPVLRKHILGQEQFEDITLYTSPHPLETLELVQSKDDQQFYFLRQLQDNTTYVSKVDFQSFHLNETLTIVGTPFLYPSQGQDYLYFISFEGVNNGQIMRMHSTNHEIQSVLPEQDFVISSVVPAQDRFIIVGIKDVANVIYIYDLSFGASGLKEVNLPIKGSAYVSSPEDGKTMASVVLHSYTHDKSVFELDALKGELNLLKEGKATEIELESQKLYYTAHNGQKAAIYLTYKKGLSLSAQTPVVLYGYGGFDVEVLPRYNPEYIPWYKRGGVLAVVTLPGGKEYGQNWHQAGWRKNKLNVFDDFATAGRFLMEQGISSPQTMAISGGSNGGLLAAATAQRYPDLFKASVPEVGVLDMVRFHLYTAGKYWMYEYGNPDVMKDFQFLMTYSPYHTIKKRSYPQMLVITSDFDDRVVPAHSYKYVARMQELQSGPDHLVMLHSVHGGAHGYKEATKQERLKVLSKMWAFLIQELMY